MDTQRRYNVYMEQGKRFSVRFPPELLEAFKRYAQEDNRSINSQIIRVLQEYARKRERSKKDADQEL
jgi:hypothetical protein